MSNDTTPSKSTNKSQAVIEQEFKADLREGWRQLEEILSSRELIEYDTKPMPGGGHRLVKIVVREPK